MQARMQILQEVNRVTQLFRMLAKLNEEIAKYQRLLRIATRPDQVQFLNAEIQKKTLVRAELQAEYNTLTQSMRNTLPALSHPSPSAAPRRKNANNTKNVRTTRRWGCEGGVCGWLFGSKTRNLRSKAPNAAAQAAEVATVQASQAARAARLAQAAAARAAEQAAINAEVNAMAATLPRGPPLEGANAQLAAQVAQLEAEAAAEAQYGSLGPEHNAVQEELKRGTQRVQEFSNILSGVRRRGGKRKSSKLRKTKAKAKNSRRHRH
uniref:Uncharacterized protein n=1 Tax=viral metagenome TaxID=1070528 RepID=A0A6C0ANB5_9ZZZZ